MWEFGDQFFNLQIPLEISPLLVPVEFISYISRIISLCVRLFANISSGHSLLKILIGFSWVLSVLGVTGVTFTDLSGLLIALNAPWSIVSSVMVLENLIACLQGYVFIILFLIYTSDVVVRH
jgi:F-type H+-transporting ATPase subunit a